MASDAQASMSITDLSATQTSRIPRAEQPDRRLLVDLMQDTLLPRVNFKHDVELPNRHYPQWPELGSYYSGPLLSSFSLSSEQLQITLTNGEEITVLARPTPSKLTQDLGPYVPPEYTYPTTSSYQTTKLSTPRVLRLLEVFTLVLNSLSAQDPDFFRAPRVRKDNVDEAAYSLNLIGALVGRFVGHACWTWPQMVDMIREYRASLILRLRDKFGESDQDLEGAMVSAGLFEELEAQPWDGFWTAIEKVNSYGRPDARYIRRHSGVSFRGKGDR